MSSKFNMNNQSGPDLDLFFQEKQHLKKMLEVYFAEDRNKGSQAKLRAIAVFNGVDIHKPVPLKFKDFKLTKFTLVLRRFIITLENGTLSLSSYNELLGTWTHKKYRLYGKSAA